MLDRLRFPRGNRAIGAEATADFYFLGALADLVDPGDGASGRPIRRLGPHIYACGRDLVIIRYITPAERDRISERRWRRVFYLVDDLLPFAAASLDLPPDYRKRLAHFCETALPHILALEPVVLAPSQAILDAFRPLRGERVSPCALALATCFDEDFWRRSPLKLAFFGTRSHAASLDFLRAVAEGLLKTVPAARLTLFFGRHAPRALRRLPNVDNRAPLAWPAFRALLSRERFHLGLAPIPDTPFARARSFTKLLDHAACGATGLYSDAPPFAEVLSGEGGGVLLPWRAGAWVETIAALDADRGRALALAKTGVALAARVGDRARLREFWAGRLDLCV